MKKEFLGSLALATVILATSCAPSIPVQSEDLPAAGQIQPVMAKQTVEAWDYQIVSQSYEENGVHIRYPQITGLLDTAQQDLLNQCIKNGALNGLKYYENIDSEIEVDIGYTVTYFDENLISIVYSGVGNAVGAAHPNHLFYTSNLRMSTGESIRLKDFIDVDTAFAAKLIAGEFQPVKKEYSSEYAQGLAFFTADEWAKRLTDADPEDDIGPEYSYFTEKYLGVSVAVAHVMGDHAEFEIPYGDIWNNIRAKDDPAYATLLSSAATSVPASTASSVALQSDTGNQIITITNITPRGREYRVDVVIWEPVTIETAKFEEMRLSKYETIKINGQRWYFVDEATYRSLQPNVPRPEDAVGVLYPVNEDAANGGAGPAFSVELKGGVYNVCYDAIGGTPYREIGTKSYHIASDTILEVIALGVSRADMKYVQITPDAFYDLFRNLDKEDPSGYYRSGFFGAGFICEAKDGKIVRLHENYMP